MTVIRPNSISGVTSITAQGGDINVFRADGTAGDLVVNNINAGVSTFSGNVSIGGTLTYEDVTNIDSVGLITARGGINLTGGNITLGDSGGSTDDRIKLGAGGDLEIYHSGSNSFISDVGTGDLILTGTVIRPRTDQFTLTNAAANEVMIQGLADGAVSLYHNASKKFETTAAGATVTGGLTVTADVTVTSLSTFSAALKTGTDDTLIRLGASDDLVMWHSSNSNSYIKNNTGELYIASDNIRLCTTDQSEKFIDCNGNGNVELYYDNVKKLETTGGGVDISGTTDGMLNLNTTDARGPFIRYKVSGTSKVFAGCGEGLGLGSENDFGIRTDAHLRIRTGTEEHAMLTDEGFFAAKGMAGNWVSNQSPASTQAHQFNNTGVSKWVCQFEQEHHAGFGVQIQGNSTANSEAFVIYSNSNNTTRFRVLWDGNCANANNSFGSLSDISIKENIVDAKSQWDDIKAVKVRNFNLKNDPDTKMLGVVAQEIETVSPKLVWEDREGLKGVSYSVLYMKAIKALQESQTRIETLESKVAALEGS